MNKLAASWELVKASARVLKEDKELLVFPILSTIGTFIITITFALPILLTGFAVDKLGAGSEIAGLVIAFLFYLVQYTVIFFANTALVGAALIRLRGGDPTLKDGFRIAFSHFLPILGYALIASTVGMLLRAISQRAGTIGRIVVSLVGFAWNVATFLVVPILAVEDVGPIEAIKRSVALLRKTWGEQLIGNFGMNTFFGLVTFLLFLVFIPVIILIAISAQPQIWLIISLTVLFVLLLVVLGLISSTLNGIYMAAVYQFAENGTSSTFFEPQLVENAFKSQPMR